MSLIYKGPDSLWYEPAIKTLTRQLLKGQCVLFLGAGASIGDPPSLPTGSKLSEDLAKKCKLDWHDYVPLSTIAFYYESLFSRQDLNELLVEQFDQDRPTQRSESDKIPPSATIKKLMEIIDVLEKRRLESLAITTNYDRHFERAYIARFGRSPDVVIYRGGWNPNARGAKLHYNNAGEPVSPYWNPKQPTSLYKMHGCISQVKDQSLVITEEDYINFLTNALGENPDNRLLWYVRGQLETSTILFLGYSLADWNFRTIFKATVERRENKDMKSYAVQFHPPAAAGKRDLLPVMANFWHEKKVDIINVRADEFVADLLQSVQEAAREEVNVGAGRP